jgi:hypothetical protein
MWFIFALANYLSEKHICMAKKTVIRLTEGQLAEIIKDITLMMVRHIQGFTMLHTGQKTTTKTGNCKELSVIGQETMMTFLHMPVN